MVWRIFIEEPAGVMHIDVIACSSFFAIANNSVDFLEFRHDVFLEMILLIKTTG
jgi:hypothetical protein